MRGVRIDLSGRPILRRVMLCVTANLLLVILLLVTGTGRSPVADAGHSMSLGSRGRAHYRPVVGRYIQVSLLVFVGTMLYAGVSARRH